MEKFHLLLEDTTTLQRVECIYNSRIAHMGDEMGDSGN